VFDHDCFDDFGGEPGHASKEPFGRASAVLTELRYRFAWALVVVVGSGMIRKVNSRRR
jgi:hypothetical protein